MGNMPILKAHMEGRDPYRQRPWQPSAQRPSAVVSISGGNSSGLAPAPAAGAAQAASSTVAAPAEPASVPQAAEVFTTTPEEALRSLKSRWGDTTMYKRLEKERQVFMREALDGVVLVLPWEYADVDASEYLSAAHPPRMQPMSRQQHQQPQRQPQAVSGHELPASGSESSIGCGSSSSSNRGPAASSSTTTASSSSGSCSGSSSVKNSRAAGLLSRFPAAVLQYSALEPEGIKWLVALEGAPGTAYAGEKFLLRFQFVPKYPIDSPELVFVVPYVPLHPHVYSNGHICLSILYDHWSPALGVKACSYSLLSMLSSNRVPLPPPDDRQYCESRGHKGPKGVRWIFHDDKV